MAVYLQSLNCVGWMLTSTCVCVCVCVCTQRNPLFYLKGKLLSPLRYENLLRKSKTLTQTQV